MVCQSRTVLEGVCTSPQLYNLSPAAQTSQPPPRRVSGRRPPVSLAVAVGLGRVLVVSGDTSQSGHSTKHLLPVERCCSGYGVITPSLRHWKSRRWFLHALSLQEMRNRRRERERERERERMYGWTNINPKTEHKV